MSGGSRPHARNAEVLKRVDKVNTPNTEYVGGHYLRLEKDLEGSVVLRRVGDMNSPVAGLRLIFSEVRYN